MGNNVVKDIQQDLARSSIDTAVFKGEAYAESRKAKVPTLARIYTLLEESIRDNPTAWHQSKRALVERMYNKASGPGDAGVEFAKTVLRILGLDLKSAASFLRSERTTSNTLRESTYASSRSTDIPVGDIRRSHAVPSVGNGASKARVIHIPRINRQTHRRNILERQKSFPNPGRTFRIGKPGPRSCTEGTPFDPRFYPRNIRHGVSATGAVIMSPIHSRRTIMGGGEGGSFPPSAIQSSSSSTGSFLRSPRDGRERVPGSTVSVYNHQTHGRSRGLGRGERAGKRGRKGKN